MNQSPLVYIIILNWNKLSETLECMESVFKSDYPNFKVVLVDNHSHDNPAGPVKKTFPQVEIIENKVNLGYTGGNNAGLKYAVERGADYLWLLNNDTVVEPAALSHLVNSAETDSRIGLVSPLIYFYDHPDKIEFCGRYVSWTKKKIFSVPCENWAEHLQQVSGREILLTGTALLIRRRVIEAIGYLDESYFAYYEDDDFSIRALKGGFLNQVSLPAKIYHKSPLVVGLRPDYYYFYMIRNRYFFYSRHFGIHKKCNHFLIWSYLYHLLLYAGICASRKNAAGAKACLEGAWAALKGLSGPRGESFLIPFWVKSIAWLMIIIISNILVFRRLVIRKVL